MSLGLKSGWEVFVASGKTFKKHPQLLIPLLVVYLFFLSFLFFNPILNLATNHFEAAMYIITVLYTTSFFLIIACSILLELLYQKEAGQKFSLGKSIKETFLKNIISISVLAFLWIFLIISFRKGSQGQGNSLFSIVKQIIYKGARIWLFLVFPAIVWENLSLRKSFKKSYTILNSQKTEFYSAYMLSYWNQIIVFFPIIALVFLENILTIESKLPWNIALLYVPFAWSYTLYVEQMFLAELYLWHMKWEKEVDKARSEGKAEPILTDITRPSIIDDHPDLLPLL